MTAIEIVPKNLWTKSCSYKQFNGARFIPLVITIAFTCTFLNVKHIILSQLHKNSQFCNNSHFFIGQYEHFWKERKILDQKLEKNVFHKIIDFFPYSYLKELFKLEQGIFTEFKNYFWPSNRIFKFQKYRGFHTKRKL